MKRLNQTWVALGALALLAVPYQLMHGWGNLKPYIVETIAAGLAAGVIYLIALYALERTTDRAVVFWLVLAGAVLFRLQLFPLAPLLSDDLNRYRWEARIQEAGWNPYIVRPDDPRLEPLREADWERVSGRDLPTIYPPLAELTIRAAYRLLPDASGPAGVILLKLPFLAADLLLMALLGWWIRRSGGRNFQLAVYAWNPLVVVEIAASGHLDTLATVALLAACLVLRVRSAPTNGGQKSYPLRQVVSTLLLAAAALMKVFPVVLFPLWLRRQGWPRTGLSWMTGVAAAALAAACVWPYRSAWPGILDTLAYFESRYRFSNASLYSVVVWFSGSTDLATGLGVGVVAGIAVWAAAHQMDRLRAAYVLVGVILMLAPNAFAWYFTWIVPFLVFFPNPAWLLLTVLLFLSNHVLLEYHANGVWRFQPMYLWLTYGPFYALLLLQRLRARPK